LHAGADSGKLISPEPKGGSPGEGPDLRAGREAIVREHMESENRHEFDVTIDTFDRPRYEIIATGEVYDGEQEVRGYFANTRDAFPAQRNELLTLHHADDAVIAEFHLKGTHRGELHGIPATGREFTCRCAAFFIFEGDRLICERVYFDSLTIMAQLGLLDAAPTLS
jgi:steroid delta-isomerase-like uncharacterized protein